MSNGHDNNVVLEYSGSRALYAIPRLVQGNRPPTHYIDPTLILNTRSKIDHDWAMIAFDSFYVFNNGKIIGGEKAKIKRRTEKSVNKLKRLAEVIHDDLYNSRKQAAEDVLVQHANARGITTPENQRVTPADDVMNSFQQEDMLNLFCEDELQYFSHGFVIVREIFHTQSLDWSDTVVEKFQRKYGVRFNWSTALRKNFALKMATSCSGLFLKKLIGTQSRAVGAHWCERKCLRSGKKINNEIWTKCRLPKQLSFGTCASGYKVVVSMNDDVSTSTGEQDVTESLRDL